MLKKIIIIIILGLLAFPLAYYTGEKFSTPPFHDGEKILVKGEITEGGKISLNHNGIFEMENISEPPKSIVIRGKYSKERIFVKEYHKPTTLERLGFSFDFFGKLSTIFTFLILFSSLIKRRY